MEYPTRGSTNGRINYTFWTGLLTVFLIIGVAGMACKGPSGPEGERGPEGPEGPEGPVGPAGEDGSRMYADDGEPGDDIGAEGDYYLNQQTGELYGPKDSNGWDDPGVVLMGEDGADGEDGQDGSDGQDGADGQDGEDGSQIYSGSGEPDAELGAEGDYYLNEEEHDLYGPKTSNGWGSPLDLKGADGNANVTRYIFPEHDYSENSESQHEIDISVAEMEESLWEVYLVRSYSNGINANHVPGWGSVCCNSQYSVRYLSFDNTVNRVEVHLKEGTGEHYDNIYIIQIRANDTEEYSKRAGKEAMLPKDLDVSDYKEVAEHYGFGSNH